MTGYDRAEIRDWADEEGGMLYLMRQKVTADELDQDDHEFVIQFSRTAALADAFQQELDKLNVLTGY